MRAQQYIDSLRSERALGMDAHGAAYLALDEKLAHTGAIKTHKNPASPDPGCRQASVRVRQVFRGLRQPTIAKTCEFGAWHAYKAGIVHANITSASTERHCTTEVAVDEGPTVRRYTCLVSLVMFELSTDDRPVRGSAANLDATLQENFPAASTLHSRNQAVVSSQTPSATQGICKQRKRSS